MMNINLKPGNYVVAVSGGVDSMVLLDVLQKNALKQDKSNWNLIVAHFDHGIREDSAEDRKLVQTAARTYGLPFVFDVAQLRPGTSEAVARSRRYSFLHSVQNASSAQAIITAHHQDDQLETAIINLLRGTGRKGLTALNSRSDITRPLLHISKRDLIAYAQNRDLAWREDSTNQDQTYLRNYIRNSILPRLDESATQQLRQILAGLQLINWELDKLLVNQLHIQSVGAMIDRQWFNQLPHNVAKEIMATWLRAHGESNFNSKTLERLVIAAKVAKAGKIFSLSKNHSVSIGKEHLALTVLER